MAFDSGGPKMEMNPHMRGRELTIRAPMANLCNVDGRIVPEDDARVPVLDRGFLFGDSIYEVVRTSGGVPFGWAEHWARLCTSADGLRMRLDLDEAKVAQRVAATVAAANHGDSYVRIVVTRGAGTAPNIDLSYASGPPFWLIMVRPLPDLSGKPARLCIVDRLRNDRRALDPATKSGNYLNNVLALAEAKDRGATDCVMLNVDGHVTEASTSNLFARVNGVWCTPPLGAGILAGITRAMLLAFLPSVGEKVAERELGANDLRTAEELFLSSSLRDIAPVTHLDGRALHGGAPGPRTMQLFEKWKPWATQRHRTQDAPHWQRLLAR